MSGSIFEQTLLTSAQFGQYGDGAAQAWGLYRKALRQGRIKQLAAALAGRSRRLRTLPEKGVNEGVYQGVVVVPLDNIHGSENRSTDFDIDFYPLKSHSAARWIAIAIVRWQETPLPPVDLLQVADTFFVRDGHHRISVARAMGQTQIDALVTVLS